MTVSDIRSYDAARGSVKLRECRCESERVSVRTWYAFLSTYCRIDFNEVPLTFDTAHMKRGKPSKPGIPLLFSNVFENKRGSMSYRYLNSRSISRFVSRALIF